MPLKRNAKKNKLSLKQKRAMESRLMQISITIDRYLYSNKMITASEAANYIQEITPYKIQCEGDTRSLQVIEKITRCMKAIIAEQEENNLNIPLQTPPSDNHLNISLQTQTNLDNHLIIPLQTQTNLDNHHLNIHLQTQTNLDKNLNIHLQTQTNLDKNLNIPLQIPFDNQTYCPSPVYSLIDESETLDLNLNNKQRNEDIETIELSDDDVMMPKQMQVDVQVHKTTSCLSVHDDNNASQYTQASQSILNDFNEKLTLQATNDLITLIERRNEMNHNANEKLKQNVMKNISRINNATIIEESNRINETAKKTDVNKKASVKFVKTNLKEKTVNFKNSPPKDSEANNTTSRNRKKGSNSCCTNDKSTFKAKTNAKGNRKKTCEIDVKLDMSSVETVSNKKINKRSANKEKNTRKTRLNEIKVNCTTVSETLFKKSTITNSRALNELINPSIVQLTNKEAVKPLPEIYNSAVENDLSWIENIRYVREIDKNVYDSTFSGLNSGFWDSIDFPGYWNDRDFEI